MSYVVLTGSHSLEPLVGIIEHELLGTQGLWAGALGAEHADALAYSDTNETLAALASRLDRGEVVSIQFRREMPSPLLIGVYRPKFCGARLKQWTCVLEGSEAEMSELYGRLQQADALTFVALSLDEAPDLDFEDVSIATFPWDAWSLVRAQVRAPSGTWTERDGPAAR